MLRLGCSDPSLGPTRISFSGSIPLCSRAGRLTSELSGEPAAKPMVPPGRRAGEVRSNDKLDGTAPKGSRQEDKHPRLILCRRDSVEVDMSSARHNPKRLRRASS